METLSRNTAKPCVPYIYSSIYLLSYLILTLSGNTDETVLKVDVSNITDEILIIKRQ